MFQFDQISKMSKELMDSSLESFAAMSKGLQAINVEAAEYSKRSFEQGTASFEKLVSAKSLEKAFELQSDFARQAYEGFVGQTSRMGDLYADMAKDVYKPFESALAKAK
ncbi:phasin family protein [Aquibium sp. A9E412]|uniref:phasin family protein n=1 Tax=Aquibium sp. A9E412 TaxID=2976767 RepID=UPI0025B06FDF|nr:phasin family protein [Aquibium sp. A9E412]MDN2564721.1 phasin family protein [Aquibium sp. A9E412]